MTLCAKCSRPVLGANRRKRMPAAHAVCPRRKGHRKVKRSPNRGRLEAKAWKARKEECFLRDGATCVDCGICLVTSGEITDIHHVIKRSKGGTDSLENLVTLCRKCHNKRHPEHRVQLGRIA